MLCTVAAVAIADDTTGEDGVSLRGEPVLLQTEIGTGSMAGDAAAEESDVESEGEGTNIPCLMFNEISSI